MLFQYIVMGLFHFYNKTNTIEHFNSLMSHDLFLENWDHVDKSQEARKTEISEGVLIVNLPMCPSSSAPTLQHFQTWFSTLDRYISRPLVVMNYSTSEWWSVSDVSSTS